MKQVCDRREAEIIENLDSLIGTLSLEGIECDITILEQEQMLENIKKKLNELENVIRENTEEYDSFVEYTQTQEYQDDMNSFLEQQGLQEFKLEMWKETDEAQDKNPKIELNLATQMADEALIEARKVLNKTGYTHAIIYNVEESMQIVRKSKKQEIVTYNINAKIKKKASED